MNRSVLVITTLGALIAAAVVAALVLSPSPPADLGKGRPPRPPEKAPPGKEPGTAPGELRPTRPPDASPPGDPAVLGTVVDAAGQPVAGAEVLLYAGRPPLPAVTVTEEEEARRRAVAVLFQYRPEDVPALRPISAGPGPVPVEKVIARSMTDETGAFRIGEPPLGTLRVVARKDSRTSPERQARRGSKVRLVLSETAVLRGTVRSADDGRPLAEAAVRATVAGLSFSVATGADGTFCLEGLPGGPAALVTSHPEFAGDSRRDVLLQPGREKELEIQLSKGIRLTVTVTGLEGDELDGPVLAGATVGLVRTADKVYVLGTTGEDGKAVFEGLPAGDWIVNASREGWLPSGEERVVLDREKEHRLSLEKAVLTVLKVVDERGVPVADAEVYTGNVDEEFEQGVSRRAGATDQAGEFAFPFDFMGPDAVVFVMKADFGAAIVQPDDYSAGDPIQVVLRPGSALRGTVTDGEGKPVAGARVVIDMTVEDFEADDLTATLYTNAAGRYVLPSLPVGSVYLQVEAEGFETAEQDFENGPGAGEAVRDFRLEKTIPLEKTK